MPVRAKFKVNRIERALSSTQTGVNEKGNPIYGLVEVQTIVMNVVTSGSEDNQKFFASTPSGEIKLGTINVEAAAQFELNKEYYIDFTAASD